MKIAIRELPAGAFPFCCELVARLSSLDFARHVNNASIAAFHEEVRVRFHVRYFGEDSVFNRRPDGGVVAHVSIEYLRETLYGHPIIGCAGVASVGNSSYTVAHALFQSGQCVSEATCVIALRD